MATLETERILGELLAERKHQDEADYVSEQVVLSRWKAEIQQQRAGKKSECGDARGGDDPAVNA